jgi:hypothetical protein
MKISTRFLAFVVLLALSAVACRPKVEPGKKCVDSWSENAAPLTFILPKPDAVLCIYQPIGKTVQGGGAKYKTNWDQEGTADEILAGMMASLTGWTPTLGTAPTVKVEEYSRQAVIQMQKGKDSIFVILTQSKPPFLTRAYTHVSLELSVAN